jgi:hypothetical protein
MPLLDLSLATQTLSTVLERRVKTGLATLGQPTAGLNISALPADKLTGDDTIGIYLYHVSEDAHFKNLAPLSQDRPPVQFRPMGLNLYYQLSSHSEKPLEAAALHAHMLFGLALKALHDFPSIDSSTKVFDPDAVPPAPTYTPVFPIDLQGTDNVLRIVLQAIQPSEAPHYWTGGTQPLRLAAYYIVSVVLLEPERPSQYAGRVLRYGVHTFVTGAPRLNASSSTVTFRVPGETVANQIEVQPAEVSAGTPPGILPAHVGGQIRLQGVDLTGDDTTLLLKNSRFPEGVEVGPTWGVVASQSEIIATAASQIGTFATIPGIYSASARVTTRRRMPDGSIKSFVQTSNEVPFLVTPQITSTPVAAQVVTVNGNGFIKNSVPPDPVKLLVGAQEVPQEVLPSPLPPPPLPLSVGHFVVDDTNTLRLRFPISGISSGQILPLRIMVNGTENVPYWLTIP